MNRTCGKTWRVSGRWTFPALVLLWSWGLAAEQAVIAPDYSETTLPPNIAPLNFRIDSPGARFKAQVAGEAGTPVEATMAGRSVRFPLRPWKALLRENASKTITFRITAADEGGSWRELEPITNRVAPESIDSHLVYRLIGPVFNLYQEMGIYQRDLESFTETPLLRNNQFNEGCVNCHTFRENDPSAMVLHIREKSSGNPMLILRSNEVTTVGKTAGYPAWHPSGQLVVFSAGKISMFFHSAGETRDVFDSNSDLGVYHVESNALETPKVIAEPQWLETWPAWSPDGRQLYFCRGPKLPVERYRQLRYDLVRVAYDPGRNAWGEVETIVASRDTGLSASQPRVSPDGARVVFCLSKYGNFPVYQPSSDLYSLDTGSRSLQRLEINTERTESWHGWSHNGRWLVFSSKRRDGLFSRPYFSYLDAAGRFHKPFILPQQDPDFYDSFLKNFNRPELATGPVIVSERSLVEAILRPSRLRKPVEAATLNPVTATPPDTGTTDPGYEKAHE